MRRIFVVSGFAAMLGVCSSPVKNADNPKESKTISVDTVWAAKGTHQVTCDLYVKAFLAVGDSARVIVDSGVTIYVGSAGGNAILTVGKGSVFTFGKDAGVAVGLAAPATFIARGAPGDSIRFTKSPGMSHWGYNGPAAERNSGGIRIGPCAQAQTSLTYCVIEYATAGLYAVAPELEVSDCVVRNCLFDGMVFSDNYYYGKVACLRDSFSNNTIENNGGYPLIVSAGQVGKVSLSNRLAGNARNGIIVEHGIIWSPAIWKNHSVSYTVCGPVEIRSELTIQPGCRFELMPQCDKNGYGMQRGYLFTDNGKLTAQGTPADSIVFTKAGGGSAGSDYHGGISLGLYDRGSSLRYCRIEYAFNGIMVASRHIEISNCTVRNCVNFGILFSPDGGPRDSASFLNNVITKNDSFALSIFARNAGKLSGTGDFSGNKVNGILVHGDSVPVTAIWKKHNVPYVISGEVKVSNAAGAVLTIHPGCRLEFMDKSSLQIGHGTLIAQGYPNDSIIFTKHAGATWWGFTMGGIWIGRSAAQATALHYCDISYATSGIYAEAATSIQNCRIHDNKYYGIDFTATGLDANVKNNTFGNNPMGDIHQ